MVTRQERRWVFNFAIAVLIITSLPYVLGYWAQNDEWVFSGFVFGVEDGNSYIAKMLNGAAGDWLFRTPYTAYPQQGMVVYMPYLLLGKLVGGAAQHEQMLALYQLFRWLGGFLSIWATYDFLALYVGEVRLRRWGTVLATVGGGLGWLSVLGLQGLWHKGLALEFYSPETFGFLQVYGLPHLAVGRAMLLWGLRGYLLSSDALHPLRTGMKVGLFWVVLGLMQPMTVLIGWGVIGLHGLIVALVWRLGKNQSPDWVRWRRSVTVAIGMGLVSAPMVLYTIVALQIDPQMRSWHAQNLILSPPVLDYILAFGLVLPLAWVGGQQLVTSRSWSGWLAVGWVCVFPFLAYAPYNLQRRLPEGVWVAWVALLVVGLMRVSQRWQERLLRFVYLPTVLSAVILVAGGAMLAVQRSPQVFRPAAEVQAYDFLAQNAQHGDVVLASFQVANYLAAWAPVRVVIGHGPESANLRELSSRVDRFYSADGTDEERRLLLDEFSVRYVFWGPGERACPTQTDCVTWKSWNPAEANYLQLVYSSGAYQIFAVRRGWQ